MYSIHNRKLLFRKRLFRAFFLLAALVTLPPVATWGDSSPKGEEGVWMKQSTSNLYPLVRVEQKNPNIRFTFSNPYSSRKEVRSVARRLLKGVEEIVAGHFEPGTNRMVVFAFISKVGTLQMLTTTFSEKRKQQRISSFEISPANSLASSAALGVYQHFETTKEGRKFVSQRGLGNWWPRKKNRKCPTPAACLPPPPAPPSQPTKPTTPPTEPEASPIPAPPPIPPLPPGGACLSPCGLKVNPNNPNELSYLCCGPKAACVNSECVDQEGCVGCDSTQICEQNRETNKFECKCLIPDDGSNLCTATDSSPICPKLYPAHEPQCLREISSKGCVRYLCLDTTAGEGCTTHSLRYCYTGYVFDRNNRQPVCCSQIEACVEDSRGEPWAFDGRSCQRQSGCFDCSAHQRCVRTSENPDVYGCVCNFTQDPCTDSSRCGAEDCHSRQDHNGCFNYKCGEWSEKAPPPVSPIPTFYVG